MEKEHNLPGHYGPYDKDLEELFWRASEMDNIVLNYLRELERVMQYPPKAFRSCRGILALEKNMAVTVWSQPRLRRPEVAIRISGHTRGA